MEKIKFLYTKDRLKRYMNSIIIVKKIELNKKKLSKSIINTERKNDNKIIKNIINEYNYKKINNNESSLHLKTIRSDLIKSNIKLENKVINNNNIHRKINIIKNKRININNNIDEYKTFNKSECLNLGNINISQFSIKEESTDTNEDNIKNNKTNEIINNNKYKEEISGDTNSFIKVVDNIIEHDRVLEKEDKLNNILPIYFYKNKRAYNMSKNVKINLKKIPLIKKKNEIFDYPIYNNNKKIEMKNTNNNYSINVINMNKIYFTHLQTKNVPKFVNDSEPSNSILNTTFNKKKLRLCTKSFLPNIYQKLNDTKKTTEIF